MSRSNTQSGITIIKEGHVRCKEDKFLATWNSRYLILREYKLEFLKNDSSKVVISFPLSSVTAVARSEESKMAFEVTRLANPKDASSKSALLTRDLPTKTITCEVKSDDEIYEWIDKIYERCPGMGGVSNPTNFSHRVHVGFDPKTGAFVGLPPEWEKLLTASAITKEDYKKNPQAVIEVLEFYSDIKMREQNPQYYAGMNAPSGNGAKPYGNSVGNSIAPPRPPPPGPMQRLDSGQSKQSEGSMRSVSSPQGNERAVEQQKQADHLKELAEQERRRLEDIRRKEEQDAYNQSIPQTRTPMAKQELGGYGGEDASSNSRYQPSRPAPQAPGAGARPQDPRQLTAQRPAPAPPSQSPYGQSAPRAPGAPRAEERQGSPNSRYPPNEARAPGSATRPQQNGSKGQQAQGPPPTRLPAPVQAVKPLNIANKQNGAKQNVPDGVRQAEAALTKKPEPRQKEVRMSAMSENEVMDRLRSVVSKDNPNESYSKQRKIGQGASGSVYVARVKEGATSSVASELYRQYGPRCQVAIKQMDLRSQPRKELIVNEIIVMKDSQHANIVNFLDSFLQESSNELWVVMEFMEGGALTDVIDNNQVITEGQIATICVEVSLILYLFYSQ
jgi:protein-serine/threonine kinase